MKRRLLRLGVVAAVIAVGAFLLAASGIVPITASGGHWPVTEWFLRFSMQRSIALHSLGVTVPPLDDPALVLKGAGHYETGCRSCHGSPGEQAPRIAQAMLPRPPELGPRIRQSNPKRLFYVVKHGLKFTGMPAWPSQQRDDEVWAMIAFLLKMPELSGDEYQRLVFGETMAANDAVPGTSRGAVSTNDRLEPAAPLAGARSYEAVSPASPLAGARSYEAVSPENPLAGARGNEAEPPANPLAGARSYEAVSPADPLAGARGYEAARLQPAQACIRCHGSDGEGRGSPAFPRIAGQREEYLRNTLEAYARGSRHSGMMEPLAAKLTPAAIREVAGYYAKRDPIAPASRQVDEDSIARGRAIAHEGIRSRRIPACIECHGPTGRRHKPAYPSLAGQRAEYLVLQLELFRDRRRGGSGYAHLMEPVASRLEPQQMHDVARYFESLPADRP